MGGKTGRLFIEFGVVLSFAVIISSFVALTLTPMMCSKILEKNQKHEQRELFFKFKRFYESSLLASQKNTKIVYSVTIIFIIISFLLFKFIPKELAPSEDRGIFIVSVNGPEASGPLTDTINIPLSSDGANSFGINLNKRNEIIIKMIVTL